MLEQKKKEAQAEDNESEADSGVEEEVEAKDYEAMAKKEIVKLCRAKGLKFSEKSTKNLLIALIKDSAALSEAVEEAVVEEAIVEEAIVEEAAVEESPVEEAEPEPSAEETAEEATEEAAPEAMEDEEDGPLEDWTRKELAEECKTLGLSDKGVKAVLIIRIKEHKAAAAPEPVAEEALVEEVPAEEVAVDEEAVEEAAAEEAAVEEAPAEETTVEEVAAEEAALEEAVPEPVVEEAAAEEEDGPLEDWTRKELAEECKTMGLSDKGVKAVLINRIKEAKEAAPALPNVVP